MRSKLTGERPLPALGQCSLVNSHGAGYGAMASMVFKNSSRCVCLRWFSKVLPAATAQDLLFYKSNTFHLPLCEDFNRQSLGHFLAAGRDIPAIFVISLMVRFLSVLTVTTRPYQACSWRSPLFVLAKKISKAVVNVGKLPVGFDTSEEKDA